MSKELRALAKSWRDYKINNMSNTAEHIGMLFVHKRNFENAVTPDVVLALLDRLDRQERVMREALAAFNRIVYIECDKLSHHGKNEFHAPHEVCPVVGSVNDAIAAIEKELVE